VIPDDVKELAVPVLAHRIVLRGISYQLSTDKFVQDLLSQVAVPTEKV
jgi:MoxR-like ATPase